MKLSNRCVMVNNKFEKKNFIYDRNGHIKYEINNEMFELIKDIHDNKKDYKCAILDYDKDIIDELVSLEILTNNEEKYIFNIKQPSKLNSARIFLEITDKCNLNCKHCYGGFASKNRNMISLNDIDNIIDEAVELGIYEFDITGGEPLLYHKLEDVLSKLYDSGMLVSIFTNLTLLTNHHLEIFNKYCVKKVITSIDSCYKNVHDEFRGCNGCFDKTMKNIEKLKKLNIELSINTMIGNHNIKYIDEMIIFLKKLELPFVLDVITNEGRAMTLNENISTSANIIKTIFSKYNNDINKEMNFKHCGIGNRFIYIKSDGNIYICPSLIDDKYKIGNIKQKNLYEVWENMTKRFGNLSCSKKSNKCKKCNGGCRARALKLHNNIMDVDNVYCTIVKGDVNV